MMINDTIAIVTGAGSGLGAATAQALAKRGAKVMVLDLNAEAAAHVAAQINGVAFDVNVADPHAAEQALRQIVDTYGTPRICVNCAGIAPAKRIVGRQGAMALADFAKVIEVNLIGTFNIMRLVAAAMMASEPVSADHERGVIINTASVAAFEGQIGQAAYSAAKGGVAAMTLPAAREFANTGIRVMCIAPGIFATPMMQAMPAEVQASLAASVPFPKRLGDPAEYAALVLQIVENTMLNGSVIRLDGAIRMAAK